VAVPELLRRVLLLLLRFPAAGALVLPIRRRAPFSSSSSRLLLLPPRRCLFGAAVERNDRNRTRRRRRTSSSTALNGWVQRKGGSDNDDDGEWVWEEDDPNYAAQPAVAPIATATTSTTSSSSSSSSSDVVEQFLVENLRSSATPQLPSRTYKPKQSLGQNYLKDPNTVAKIVRAFHADMTAVAKRASTTRATTMSRRSIVELGPGAGALTDRLVELYCGNDSNDNNDDDATVDNEQPSLYDLQVVEIDDRSVQLLKDKHPSLKIRHDDVLQIDYARLAQEAGGQPLSVIGNLPYYITSQILFALADASHVDAVSSATVTMQWEVAQRMVAQTSTKEYGILSVVFQIYCADVKCHFKIPPTVFYPKPKVDSALVGLQFRTPEQLLERLRGASPAHLRRVVTTAFRQRRKTLRNSLRKLVMQDICDGDADESKRLFETTPSPPPLTTVTASDAGSGDIDDNACSILPTDWASKRPEELAPEQFIELTRHLFGPSSTTDLGKKVWRKLKHGT